MKKIFLILSIFFCQTSFAEITNEIYCFGSSNNKKNIKMEMRLYFDNSKNWSGGYVQYANSKKKITVFLKNEKADDFNKNTSLPTAQIWVEFFGGNAIGEYALTRRKDEILSMV